MAISFVICVLDGFLIHANSYYFGKFKILYVIELILYVVAEIFRILIVITNVE